jgi:hypothetical protein
MWVLTPTESRKAAALPTWAGDGVATPDAVANVAPLLATTVLACAAAMPHSIQTKIVMILTECRALRGEKRPTMATLEHTGDISNIFNGIQASLLIPLIVPRQLAGDKVALGNQADNVYQSAIIKHGLPCHTDLTMTASTLMPRRRRDGRP